MRLAVGGYPVGAEPPAVGGQLTFVGGRTPRGQWAYRMSRGERPSFFFIFFAGESPAIEGGIPCG